LLLERLNVTSYDLSAIDRFTSRARLALSLLALVSLSFDRVVDGPFEMNGLIAALLGLHLLYAAAMMHGAADRMPAIGAIQAVLDVLFAAAIAVVTEGATSPPFAFFCFAIVAVSCRQGLRATLYVTVTSVLLYGSAIAFFHSNAEHLYETSPAFLGTIGCLAAFFGEARQQFEARVRALETVTERRQIARSLHDEHVQALAVAHLRVETCRELLRRGNVDDAYGQLDELRAAIARDYDGVRSYIHSLAAVDERGAAPAAAASAEPWFRVHAEFGGRGATVEHVLQIMIEGIRNTLRHGAARSASVEAWRDRSTLHVCLRDDGVGFPRQARPPWSIASRVADLGGSLRIAHGERGGARVDIELPADAS
jgi:signal transduction histidine kinase